MAREEAYQKQIRELMNRLVGCGSKFAIKCCVQKLEEGGGGAWVQKSYTRKLPVSSPSFNRTLYFSASSFFIYRSYT